MGKLGRRVASGKLYLSTYQLFWSYYMAQSMGCDIRRQCPYSWTCSIVIIFSKHLRYFLWLKYQLIYVPPLFAFLLLVIKIEQIACSC